MMKEQTINCNVAKDLMMIYEDDLISADSKALVDEHMKGCKECREYFDTVIQSRITVRANRKKNIKKFVNTLNKIRKNGIVKGAAIVLVVVIAAIIAFNRLHNLPIIRADASQLQISRVYTYDYDRKHGEGIFLYLQFPSNWTYGAMHITDEIKGDTLYLNWKNSVLHFHMGAYEKKTYDYIDTFDTSGKTINKIVCNGVTLWERSENEPEAPQYVDYYNRALWDYPDDEGREIAGWVFDGNKVIEAQYEDNTYIDWDLDGTVLKTGTLGDE